MPQTKHTRAKAQFDKLKATSAEHKERSARLAEEVRCRGGGWWREGVWEAGVVDEGIVRQQMQM